LGFSLVMSYFCAFLFLFVFLVLFLCDAHTPCLLFYRYLITI
jgi:hypothetical protein